MKIWLFSDLHLEINGPGPLRQLAEKRHDADLLICAGDLTSDPRYGCQLLRDNFSEHMRSVYVAGNHEYYREFICDFDDLPGAEDHDVFFLENSSVTIAGELRVLGCILWTDYDLFGDRGRGMAFAEITMSDHRQILERLEADSARLFKPADALARHQKSVGWLRKKLSEPVKIPTVVVTHHAPHPKSVPAEFEFNETTPAFCSDLSALIEEFQPALWVHGHTHTCFDYMVGETRVICNPHGYAYENPDFNPALVVEV